MPVFRLEVSVVKFIVEVMSLLLMMVELVWKHLTLIVVVVRGRQQRQVIPIVGRLWCP